MKPLLLGVLLVLCACTASQPPMATTPPRVETALGTVEGFTTEDGIHAFYGLPFATPPVGMLRWQAPRPPASWDGTLDATAQPPACIQATPRSRLPWTEAFMHQGTVSEDCLYLNIWTPEVNDAALRPVMVYIYGGGFNEGSNSVAVYDGEALAQQDVVLVAINYRVGPLGFLAHPELTAESSYGASGNYGLLDQVAALEWVRDHIAAFGGDPDQVTIFGQSAGGMSVGLLMQSPLAEGLFARAIIQSGPGLFSSSALAAGTPLADAEQQGARFAEGKGASSLADLRAMTPDQIMAPLEGTPPFRPVHDGYLNTPDTPVTRQVPVINGFTADDFGTGDASAAERNTVAAFEQEAHERFGNRASTFLALYSPTSDAEVAALRKASGRDRARVSLHLWAAEQQTWSNAVHTYYFDRAIPWPDQPAFGAFHTGEVPYVFNNLDALDRPWEAVDRTVAAQMSSYWTRFAHTSTPNGEGAPPWPAYRSDAAITMRIGADSGAMPIASAEAVAFWTEVLTAQN